MSGFFRSYVSNAQRKPVWRYVGFFLAYAYLFSLFYPDLRSILWTPPAEAELVMAQGRFLSHPLAQCNHPYCADNPPYRLQLNSGEIIELNCEPVPAINQCLDSNGFGRKTRELEGQEAKVAYFNDSGSGKSYNVVMSVKVGAEYLIKYENRIDYIRKTSVYPLGSAEFAVRDRTVSARSIGLLTIYLFPLYAFFVMNYLVQLLIKIFSGKNRG